MELHNKNLNYLCRICAKWIGIRQYNVTDKIKIIIEQVFLVKLTEIKTVHPEKICHKCCCTINNLKKRKTTTALLLFNEWQPHSINCATCHIAEKEKNTTISTRSFLKKAKSLKKSKLPGKYRKCWTIAMFTSIKENLIPIYNLNEDIDILELKNDLNPFLQLCLCCICNKIPQTPVSLKRCEHLFCFLCIVEKIMFKYLDENFCPKCNEKVFYDDLFTSKQTDSLLRMLTIVCSFCNSKFNLLKEYELYKSHKGICLKEASVPQSFAASISVNDVFKINENSDIPYEVKKAALHVIKQKMAKFGGKSVEFKSGGPRPIVFTQTPKAYVNSAQAAESTLRLRNTNILKHFETVAGNSCDSSISQTSKLLLSFEPDQRQSILSNTKLNHTKISANVMVAMKTDMGIPWEKLKVMSRWLKKYDITTASNASQRVVAEN
ncbi:V(D)J recombination-activating protein 1-like [Hydra vulgaris]|uniref:V(D)J recombination-activating protein 1-like n=1 Tax=Hydra vulgaris TaxID=6087 RepID=UPI001F5FE101|nr:V(D)J recombination-activating protein 1-like [Hydra vulgaris]